MPSKSAGITQHLLPPNPAAFIRGASPASRLTFWRTLQTFNVTRIVIAIVLLIYISFNTKKAFWETDQLFYLNACLLYLGIGIGYLLLALKLQRRYLLQLLSQILIDIGVISLMYIEAGGAKSGLAILYLFPLAGCAILAPLVWALFFASVVALFLLAQSSYQFMQSASEVSISQSGLFGAALLAAVLVINRLAAKLINQEELASRHSKDLQLQQAVNRLVIADMNDGVLVVSGNGAVLTVNPAAERMLSVGMPLGSAGFPLTRVTSLAPISEAFFTWKQRFQAHGPTEVELDHHAAYVMVKPNEEAAFHSQHALAEGRREFTSHLKLRFVKVDTPNMLEDWTVIFLQDVSEIENQAQQLKLASMGRLTASIAHEVRNPLSAISYAIGLLSEEIAGPAQKRLLTIVEENVARLNRMIEDILKLSRKAQPQGEPVELNKLIAEIVAEFQETHTLAPNLIAFSPLGESRVWFDLLHLREVIVNLLSNALRYASGAPGSIRIEVAAESVNRLSLRVQDDGDPITPEVRSHLFEPFYTTSSKGTGLGLYLARELCLNNGAMLDYEYHAESASDGQEQPCGRFVVNLGLAH